jgi:hypothetical protein
MIRLNKEGGIPNMRCLLTIVFFVIVISSTYTGVSLALPWYSFGGHWYTVDEQARWWGDAKAEAERQGGYLVVITSQQEQDFLTTTIGPLLDNSWKWIGLYAQNNEEGNWAWVTGELVIYTNWDGGEPNNRTNDEYFGEMYAFGTWNDITGTHYPVYGIIERDVAPVPLPGAVWLLGSGLVGLMGWRRFKKS